MLLSHSTSFRRQLVAFVAVSLVMAMGVAQAALAGAESPRALLGQMQQAVKNGNAAAAESLVDQSTPAGKAAAKVFGMVAQAAHAHQQLADAVDQKFGAGSMKKVAQASGVKFSGPLSVLRDLDSLKIDIHGQTATVQAPAASGQQPQQPLELVERNGQWYVAVPAQAQAAFSAGKGKAAMRMMTAMMKAQATLSKQSQQLLQNASSVDDFTKQYTAKSHAVMGQVMAAMMAAAAQSNGQGPAAAPQDAPTVTLTADQQPAANTNAGMPGSETPAQLWADFNHYVLIARPDLAKAAGEALLKQVKPGQLLDIAEASDYQQNYQQTLAQAQQTQDLAAVAAQVADELEQAKLDRSRDPKRIAHNIDLLNQGQRPYINAVRRLSAAGQFAAPQLLATLENPKQSSLQPYVLSAMISIGRPLVYPLSIALPKLDPVTQGEVAQTLAQIGYGEALPYMKQVLEAGSTSAAARGLVQKAYDRLAQSAGPAGKSSAAELFFDLARSQYQAGTTGHRLPGYDQAKHKGVIWEYSPNTGLVHVEVPGPIYADVRAMRSARQALADDPNLDGALSVFLASNLRRANRLPKGATDPSYPADMRPAEFYAMLAGPVRLNDVLRQALADRDPALALDAIKALTETAGTNALIHNGQASPTLLQALTYPDRLVRFRAAEALANARPDKTFVGADGVVPVLAEAVRPSSTRYAVVLAGTQDQLNDLLAKVGRAGYQTIPGLSLADVEPMIRRQPAIDLIVVSKTPAAIAKLQDAIQKQPKLAVTPVLAVVPPDEQGNLSRTLANPRSVTITSSTATQAQLAAAIHQATQTYAGTAITAKQAKQLALTALETLRELALSSGQVYHVNDALPALQKALGEKDVRIATRAAEVLALLNGQQAQRSLADAALSAHGDVQVKLLGSLADSATHYGNKLDASQVSSLMQLVRTGKGQVAIAAAQAHGALTLPTADAVKLILGRGRTAEARR